MRRDLECQGVASEAIYKISLWICARRVGALCQGETLGEIARWLVGESECGPQWIVVARSFEIIHLCNLC